MIPDTGRRFGPYEIQSRLGGGGMGHVHRAWDARLHREVAIKLLNHEYAMPGMRERFLREARAASALNHPNICTIFDIGEQDGDPYLVMELLQGETLKDRIQARTMPLEEIVSVSRETAEALGAAHAKGVVHRDVKPANIFLVDRPNGGVQAKVLDFGLAKIEGGVLGARHRSGDITSEGATVGTLAYMSPEQARGEVLDSRSDLFSLGVVMYEMATRHVPFQGATSALVFVQLLNHPPEPVREWNEAVPRELEKIIFKLLAKERTARYQTAREVELALLALTEKGSGSNWLRKAVSAVPLVRAPDPVARAKRISRPKNSLSRSDRLPAPTTAPVPAREDLTRPAEEQILRPVVRAPRGDTSANSGRNTAPPEAADAVLPAVPDNLPVVRPGDPAILSPEELGKPNLELTETRPPSVNRPILPPSLAAIPSEAPAKWDFLPPAKPASSSLQGRALTSSATRLRPVVPYIDAQSDAEASVKPDSGPFDRLPAFSTPRRFRLPFRPLWLGIGGMVVFAAALVFGVYDRGRFTSPLLTQNDKVLLADIENRTGNQALDHSVSEGLRIELAQSSWLFVVAGDANRQLRHQLTLDATDASHGDSLLIARQTAQRLNARAFIAGTITGAAAPYLLHVDLRDTASSEVIATAETRAESLQQVPDAIDQTALDLRVEAGEPRSSVDTSSAPLAREGTGNLAALRLFSDSETSMANHQAMAALADLQQAVAVDPHFIQAQMELAELYAQLHAETSSADSARLALAAAEHASQRTRALAQATYEIDTSGDFLRATSLLRPLTAAYPHDSEALELLAQTLVLEGRMAEALQNAQQAYTSDPYSANAYSQAEAALIGLDRYDAAFQLEAQAQRYGVATPGDQLTAAYLDGKQAVLDDLSASIPVGKIEYRPDWRYGLYLDNSGHLAAGSALWMSRAQAAQQNDSLKSAAVFLLSQSALDRALLGDCSSALAVANKEAVSPRSAGRIALFNFGLTDAVCGEKDKAVAIETTLQQLYPQSFDVKGFYIADINAALALHDRDPDAALAALEPARSYDLLSLTPFLRGQAHTARGNTEIGVVDFQTVLAHSGLSFIGGSDVYPAAEIGVARSFALSGDLANSAAAYRKFMDLWRTADPLNPLVIEARTHAEVSSLLLP